MRGYGIAAIVIGALVLIGAMSMDVSVATSAGRRVNNIGLMAQQQNYLIIGSLIALAGVLMTIFAPKKQLSNQEITNIMEARDSRPCPFCAEPIKHAAIKCKYCGESVSKKEESTLQEGWVALVACSDSDEGSRVSSAIEGLGLPLIAAGGVNVAAGPFFTKEDATRAVRSLSSEHRIFATVDYHSRKSEQPSAVSS